MFRERQQRARDTVTKNTSPDPALPGLVGLGSLLAPLTCVRQGLPGGGGAGHCTGAGRWSLLQPPGSGLLALLPGFQS